jgi:Uma2 family endonuclease
MGEPELKVMSVEEFLVWQLKQDRLYELVDGQPRLPLKMMTGASANHDTVTVNALASLHAQLRGGPCRPRSDDIAVRIPRGNIRRPDLLVECGKPGPKDMIAADPRLVIEVLSPSTMEFDRFIKIEEYKTVPGLAAILLVDTERPQVTLHQRSGDTWRSESFEALDTVLVFPGLEARLALADLYEGVQLDTA